ncbi:MAG: Sec-independent protein translocase protein TatA [Myxococcota bacterium]|jgi:Sec-independent protein translocase protein TatA
MLSTSATSVKLSAFIGGPELVVIVVVGIMVFGSRFPEIVREVGKMWFKLRRTMNDIKRETGLEQTLDELRRDVDPFSPTAAGPLKEDGVFDDQDVSEAAVEFIKDADVDGVDDQPESTEPLEPK